MSGFFAWPYWDRVALCAGGIPLALLLIGQYSGAEFGGLATPIMLGAVILYAISATIAWRQGDGRLIAAGCAMLVIPAVLIAPLIGLVATCLFTGNCL